MTTIQVGQKGTVRSDRNGQKGQHGSIIAVYTNGALFQSDTGAIFTLLSAEWTPDATTQVEKELIGNMQERKFGHLTDTGFVYKRVTDKQGNQMEEQIMRLPKPKVKRPT